MHTHIHKGFVTNQGFWFKKKKTKLAVIHKRN
jgi:hypothetical protein